MPWRQIVTWPSIIWPRRYLWNANLGNTAIHSDCCVMSLLRAKYCSTHWGLYECTLVVIRVGAWCTTSIRTSHHRGQATGGCVTQWWRIAAPVVTVWIHMDNLRIFHESTKSLWYRWDLTRTVLNAIEASWVVALMWSTSLAGARAIVTRKLKDVDSEISCGLWGSGWGNW